MPRRTRLRPSLDPAGALRAITEEHDRMGRLQRRVTEFFPPETDPDEMEIAVMVRREIETYTYRVATLDAGDGNPPQWQVDLCTEVYSRLDDALRLIETRVETLSMIEAQRRELQRPRPGGIMEVMRRAAGVLRPRVPHLTPPTNPTPPSQRTPPPLSQEVEDNFRRAFDLPLLPMPHVISAVVSAVNFELDDDELVSSTNAGLVYEATSMPDHMHRFLPERQLGGTAARRAMQKRSCSLEKGCQGFCATCKYCQLHCACPKPDAPPETRRIRME